MSLVWKILAEKKGNIIHLHIKKQEKNGKYFYSINIVL